MTQAPAATAGRPLSREMSVFLDAVRFAAALIVMLGHATAPEMGGGWVHLPFLGYTAVMIFFVLSGFVIAFVVDEKREGFRDFFASRFARLWSVLIPALLLTAVFDAVGFRLDPHVYAGWEAYMRWDHPVARLLAGSLFVNELWFTSTATLSNSPVWSLGFEFWYYVLFAWAVYLRGWVRATLLVATAALVGLKILLLMPVWLAGVVCWRCVRTRTVSSGLGWVLFAGASLTFVVAFGAGLGWRLLAIEQHILPKAWLDGMKYAAEVPWGWTLGALTAVAFFGFANIAPQFAWLVKLIERPIRFGADFSLSLYLVHMPTLLLTSAVLHGMKVGPVRSLLTVVSALVVSWAFAQVFERRRSAWKRAILASFARLGWGATRAAAVAAP